jgi:hypothetical protein
VTSEQAATEPEQTTVEVELFRTDDYVQAGRVPLLPLVRDFFERMLGRELDNALFRLSFMRLRDGRQLAGAPEMINLRASHGWAYAQIFRDGHTIYQHPHAVREIIAAPLQRILGEEYPDESHWGYGVRAPGLEGLALVRPAPRGEHEVGLSLDGRRRIRRFDVEEIAEPEPPVRSLADLGVNGPATPTVEPVGVVIDHSTFEWLVRDFPFSGEVEEGGFLAGRVFRAAGNPSGYLVQLTAAMPAERTGASLMHFTFTGESFLRVGAQLDARNDDLELVGWYHTHLFPATDKLGLSSIDVELHTTTFRKPAQIAGLVNLDGSTRTLRFYRSTGSEMEPAPYWVVGG